MGREPEAGGLVTEGLGKRFGRRGSWVLSGIDLRLSPGSVSVVVGGNGSGKTSLLRILVGLSRPTAGLIRARPRIAGFAPERLPARLRMTAAQYVDHMGRIRGLEEATTRERSADLFERLALTPGPHVDVRLLSKGNGQKVALVQSLLSPVGLLALDEPYGGLDQGAHRALALLLVDAAHAGAAVIITAHDRSESPGADQILQLNRGHLVSASTSRKVGVKVRVDLRAPSAHQGAANLPTLDGAQIIDHNEDGELRLLVDRIDVDATLQKMLAAGFSILYVAPADPSRDAQGS